MLPTPLSPIRGRVLKPKSKGRELGIRCFPFRSVRRHSFRFCHRRSHRHPAPPSIRSGLAALRSGDLRLPHPTVLQRAAPQPGFPLMAGASSGCITHPVRRPSCNASSASDRVGPARRRTTTRLRHRPALHLAEAFHMRVSRFARTGSATSFRSGISQVFQIVRSSGPEAFLAVPISRSCAPRADSSSLQDPSFPLSPDFSVEGGG